MNDSFARYYFGSEREALGHYVGRLDKQDTVIVGVVKDSHHNSPRDPVVRTLFRPALQIEDGLGSPSGFAYYVRTLMPPSAIMTLVRQTIHKQDRSSLSIISELWILS